MRRLLPVAALLLACGDAETNVQNLVDDAVQTANEAVNEALTDAGMGEPVNYELRMERVRDWHEAIRRLDELDLERDESIELNAGDANIVDRMAEAIREEPRMVEVIEDVGMGVREFSIISVLLPQALTVHEMRGAGLNTTLPMVTDAHLAFVAEHEAELKALLEDHR